MVKLKPNFECETTYDEINPLIKDILDTRKDDGTFQSTGVFQFDEFENILINHLFEKTKLKDELNQLKISFDSIKYLDILRKINYDDNYFEKFIKLLNEEMHRLKDLDLKKYTFLFMTNIEELNCNEIPGLTGERLKLVKKNCETLSIFKKILNLFDIKIMEKQSFYNEKTMDYVDLPEQEKIHDIISCYRGQVLRIDVNARDPIYAFDKANSRFESFLGFLSFIRNRFHLTHRRGENISFRLFNVKTGKVFMFSNDDIIDIYFYLLEEDEADEIKKELSELKLINLNSDLNITSYSNLCGYLYDIITQINNNKLLDVLYYVFSLYYTATLEERLEYSFFNFWIISECLIKSSGKRKDEKVLRVINRIVKFYKKDAFLSKRINFLYQKRNKLVHEGEMDIINQYDRNLSKLIVDCLLSFYLYSIQHFKLGNLNDFNYLITNMGKEGITLDINLMKEWKNPKETP
jgi:hypothetical protein